MEFSGFEGNFFIRTKIAYNNEFENLQPISIYSTNLSKSSKITTLKTFLDFLIIFHSRISMCNQKYTFEHPPQVFA